MRIVTFILSAVLSAQALAAPVPVAIIDRSTWPEKLDSPVLFDVASRAEVLTFAHALALSETLTQAQLSDELDLRQINMAAINTLREQLWQRLWQSFNQAQQSCEQDASFCFAIDDLAALRAQGANFVVEPDSFYAKWAPAGRAFHQQYLDELLHAAALSPQISSEVLRFSEAERNGDELNDRVFLMTFDSGPTQPQGRTDWLTDYLRRQKMNATFFVLGTHFQARRDQGKSSDLAALYKGQCVGLQGWEYRSHSHWQDWQDSVTRSVALVQGELPDNYVPLFRPPYGQRRADSGEFFAAQKLKVALWDIDSLDGTGRLTAEQTAQRVLTLMVLWRKGIVVFHDTLDRAQVAVPWLLTQTSQSGIGWQDCKTFQ